MSSDPLYVIVNTIFVIASIIIVIASEARQSHKINMLLANKERQSLKKRD